MELRWVIVWITCVIGISISLMGLFLTEYGMFGLLWFLAYIPYFIALSYVVGVEKTISKQYKQKE